MSKPNSRRFHTLPPATQAGILCNDPRFQQFAAIRCGLPNQTFNAPAAAEYLYQCCEINSRRELAIGTEANKRFQTLRTEFDAWRGKISTPR